MSVELLSTYLRLEDYSCTKVSTHVTYTGTAVQLYGCKCSKIMVILLPVVV
jgi:hypothetical protein